MTESSGSRAPGGSVATSDAAAAPAVAAGDGEVAAPARPLPGNAPGARSSGGIVLTLAVIAVVLASVFGLLVLTRDDGASTPEGAARDLLDAVAARDAIGVLASLPPGERETFQKSSTDLSAQLQRFGLFNAFDTEAVPGLKITVNDLQYASAPLGAHPDSAATVDIVGGSLTVDVDPEHLPATSHFRSLLADDFGVTIDPSATSYTRDFKTQPMRLVAIKELGGWHVSVLYTIAEALRSRYQAPDPKFGTGPAAIGADAPDSTVRDLFKAYADNDANRAMELMSPNESRALYDYSPLFLPIAKAAGQRLDADASYDVQLNNLVTSVDGSGGTRKVKIDKLDVDIRDAVAQSHIVYDGSCFVIDYRFGAGNDPFITYRTCNGDTATFASATHRPRDNPLSMLAVFGGGADLPTFTVVERNGRWFVAPATTVLDSTVTALGSMPPDQIDAFAARLGASVRAAADDAKGKPAPPMVSLPGTSLYRISECRAFVQRFKDSDNLDDARAAELVAACVRNQVALGRVDAEDARGVLLQPDCYHLDPTSADLVKACLDRTGAN